MWSATKVGITDAVIKKEKDAKKFLLFQTSSDALATSLGKYFVAISCILQFITI